MNFQIGGRFFLSCRAEPPKRELQFTYEDRESRWTATVRIEEAPQAHNFAIISACLEGPSWQEQGRSTGQLKMAVPPTLIMSGEQLDELKLLYATCYDLPGLAFAYRLDPSTYVADDGSTTIYRCGDTDDEAFQKRAVRELQVHYIMRSLTGKPAAPATSAQDELIGRFRVRDQGKGGQSAHFHDKVSNRHILVWCYVANEGRPTTIHACIEWDVNNQIERVQRTFLPANLVMMPSELAQFKTRFCQLQESQYGRSDTFFLVSF